MKRDMGGVFLALRAAGVLFVLLSLVLCAVDPVGVYMLAASAMLLVISLRLPRKE